MVDVFLFRIAQRHNAQHHVAGVVWYLGLGAGVACLVHASELFARHAHSEKIVCLVLVPKVLLWHLRERLSGVCGIRGVHGDGGCVGYHELCMDVGPCQCLDNPFE